MTRPGRDWFERLTGFQEGTPEQVRARLAAEGGFLVSDVDGRRLRCGRLETPSLAELRADHEAHPPTPGSIHVDELVGDVIELHRDPANRDALFQVASQVNLLEMISPDRRPEDGVTIYASDRTQGPACAMACGAGTIYRNHLVPLGDQLGQTETRQIDTLADLGLALGNHRGALWETRNGYVLPTRAGLRSIGTALCQGDPDRIDALRATCRIGVQWQTQVTLEGADHAVSQAYCSALPVSYSDHPCAEWREFASLVLEAAYEATFLAALRNLRRNGSDRVFLTLLGGGAFGNPDAWIQDALRRALRLVETAPLRVSIVSHRASHPAVRALLDSL